MPENRTRPGSAAVSLHPGERRKGPRKRHHTPSAFSGERYSFIKVFQALSRSVAARAPKLFLASTLKIN